MPTKNIIVSAWARWYGAADKQNAKNYPYIQELCDLLIKDGYHLIQVGLGSEKRLTGCEYRFDMPLMDLEKLLKDTGYFLAVDNFLHHAAHSLGISGIVLFGPSDPEVFGYKDQVNIIKDRSLIRTDQFGFYHLDYVWPNASSGWYPPEIIATMGKLS